MSNVTAPLTFPVPSTLDIVPVAWPVKDKSLAVSQAVAVSALPVKSPVTFPITFPVTFPTTAPVCVPAELPVKLPVTFPVKFPVTSPTKFVLIELGKPNVTLWPLTTLSISLVVPNILNDCVLRFISPTFVPSVISKSDAASSVST